MVGGGTWHFRGPARLRLVATQIKTWSSLLMAWRVTLNRSHVALWARWCVAWLAWVGWALILGAHLHPRWDEILFAISLPCFVLLPYMIATFILACIKLFLPIFVTFTHAEGVPRCETDSNGDAIKNYNQRRADPRINCGR